MGDKKKILAITIILGPQDHKQTYSMSVVLKGLMKEAVMERRLRNNVIVESLTTEITVKEECYVRKASYGGTIPLL